MTWEDAVEDKRRKVTAMWERHFTERMEYLSTGDTDPLLRHAGFIGLCRRQAGELGRLTGRMPHGTLPPRREVGE